MINIGMGRLMDFTKTVVGKEVRPVFLEFSRWVVVRGVRGRILKFILHKVEVTREKREVHHRDVTFRGGGPELPESQAWHRPGGKDW